VTLLGFIGADSQPAEDVASSENVRAVAERPFRPVLRGLLRTAEGPLYLRRPLAMDDGAPTVSREPLWWPPSKVASRRLATHLARIDVGVDSGRRLPAGNVKLSTLH